MPVPDGADLIVGRRLRLQLVERGDELARCGIEARQVGHVHALRILAVEGPAVRHQPVGGQERQRLGPGRAEVERRAGFLLQDRIHAAREVDVFDARRDRHAVDRAEFDLAEQLILVPGRMLREVDVRLRNRRQRAGRGGPAAEFLVIARLVGRAVEIEIVAVGDGIFIPAAHPQFAEAEVVVRLADIAEHAVFVELVIAQHVVAARHRDIRRRGGARAREAGDDAGRLDHEHRQRPALGDAERRAAIPRQRVVRIAVHIGAIVERQAVPQIALQTQVGKVRRLIGAVIFPIIVLGRIVAQTIVEAILPDLRRRAAAAPAQLGQRLAIGVQRGGDRRLRVGGVIGVGRRAAAGRALQHVGLIIEIAVPAAHDGQRVGGADRHHRFAEQILRSDRRIGQRAIGLKILAGQHDARTAELVDAAAFEQRAADEGVPVADDRLAA